MRLSPCRRRRILASLAWNCSVVSVALREHLSGALSPALPVPTPKSQSQLPQVRPSSDGTNEAYAYEQIQYGTGTYRSGTPLNSLPDSLSTRGLDNPSGPHSPLLFGSSYDGGLEMLFK